jgi:DNA primase large subunit
VAKILLSIISDQKLTRKYAEKKSEEYRKNLESEGIGFMIRLAKDEFSVDIEYKEAVKMGVIDFLKYRPEFISLVEADLEKGYVWLGRNQLSWILKEAIKRRILESIPKKQSFPDAMEKRAGSIKSELKKHQTQIERVETRGVSRLTEKALPPCMRSIISDLSEGSVPHNANFVLGTFLVGLKLKDEDVLKIFSSSPKFSEKIVKYQIQFMKEKEYTCPSCDSIKGYGLCVADCPRKHPISNYFNNLRNARQRPNQDKTVA